MTLADILAVVQAGGAVTAAAAAVGMLYPLWRIDRRLLALEIKLEQRAAG